MKAGPVKHDFTANPDQLTVTEITLSLWQAGPRDLEFLPFRRDCRFIGARFGRFGKQESLGGNPPRLCSSSGGSW